MPVESKSYLQKASLEFGQNLCEKKGLGLSDYWLNNFCLTTTFLFLCWDGIGMLLSCQFQWVRSSWQSPWGNIKSGIVYKKMYMACETWWIVSLRNRPSGVSMLVLLLLLWEEDFPGFCFYFFFFPRKIARSLGAWRFMERMHTFRVSRLKGHSWAFWQFSKLSLSNRISVGRKEESQQVSRERWVMENRGQILKYLAETNPLQTFQVMVFFYMEMCEAQ